MQGDGRNMKTGGGEERKRVFRPAALRWLRVQGARGPPSRCGCAGVTAESSPAGTGKRFLAERRKLQSSSPSQSDPSEEAVRELCLPLRPPHTHL